MTYCYALADHGKTLATRPLGKALRQSLIADAAAEDSVVLDFTDVLSTSHSFADEFVARLAEEASAGRVQFDLALAGTSAEVDRVVRRALERRSMDIPALV